MEVIDLKTMFGSWPKRALDLSADDLLRELAGRGISRAVTASSAAVLYDDEDGNALTLSECAGRPALIPAATLHPHDYLADEHKVAELKERGCKAFRFYNKQQGFSLDLYCLRRLLADIKQAGLPVIMDATAMEDVHKIARLSQDTGADIVCSNLGYTFEAEAIALAKDFPHLYIEAGRLTAPDGIELFCQKVGAHRLVYGSDYPFDSVLPSLLLVQTARISEAEREQIASGTAKELLRL